MRTTLFSNNNEYKTKSEENDANIKTKHYLASRFGLVIAWLLFSWNSHRAQMIQNWVQMKGTDPNVSCTKFEWIWKTWVFKHYLASRFGLVIAWLLFSWNFQTLFCITLWFLDCLSEYEKSKLTQTLYNLCLIDSRNDTLKKFVKN